MFDPFWARINEARVRVVTHVGPTDYAKYGADLSEDPDAVLRDFDALQWALYWGDRPAMDTVASLILHGLFGRFPNVRVCLSEQGTVWLPYLLRKLDATYHLGRGARFGTLDRKPSEIFREHFVVAPFPEENVARVVQEVGIEPIVFGSDFPHAEGLAFPGDYVAAQLGSFAPEQVLAIMRDNLAGWRSLLDRRGASALLVGRDIERSEASRQIRRACGASACPTACRELDAARGELVADAVGARPVLCGARGVALGHERVDLGVLPPRAGASESTPKIRSNSRIAATARSASARFGSARFTAVMKRGPRRARPRC